MRPGQNKRMRGRNRRGPNPLSRTFDSNGPDVKVRGTAQHVAEKYTQLARDAHVSGDPVAAESYLQHAEHYFRIIATAHAMQVAIAAGTYDEREDDEDDFDSSNDRFTFRTPQAIALAAAGGGNGERLGPDGQPLPEGEGDFIGSEPGMEAQTAQPPHRFPPREDRQPREDRRPNRFERPFRPRHDGSRQDGPRQDGPRQEGSRYDGSRHDGGRHDRGRNENSRFDGPRPDAAVHDAPRNDAPRQDTVRNELRTEQPRFEAPRRLPQEIEGAAPQPELPAFLTTPSRAVPVENIAATAGDEAASPVRRRRRTRGPRGDFEGGAAAPGDVPDGESA